MSESDSDHMVASLAVGFTLGFGLLTVWEAIKQTRRSRNPRRSAYIYMIWYVPPPSLWLTHSYRENDLTDMSMKG